MRIIPVETGPIATVGYLVIDESSKEAVIIDAPLDSSKYFAALIDENKIMVAAILLTHTHWDHTAECKKLIDLTGAKVYAHSSDIYRLIDPMNHTIFPLPFIIEPVLNPVPLKHLDIITAGSLEFKVIHTPGHTEGGVCFVESKQKVLFTGDTLFRGSVGRTDLPGGSKDLLIDSIWKEILTLPDQFIVYCGHGPSTTIGWERLNNPFLN
jgi:glyoxylase-like metal-dependent hydrolase (beta-lactamase superfamily II)